MTTSITVRRSLQVEVLALNPDGTAQQLTFRLSRLSAQQLAETLRAFAVGNTTKAAGQRSYDVFLADDVYQQAKAGQPIRLVQTPPPQLKLPVVTMTEAQRIDLVRFESMRLDIKSL